MLARPGRSSGESAAFRRDQRTGLLYASLIALVTFISNGTSTHLPEFIASYGLPVTIGVLWASDRPAPDFWR